MGRNQNDESLVLGAPSSGSVVSILNTNVVVANGTQALSITNVGPAGVGTATISKWLTVDIDGTLYYIPMWT